MTTHFTYLSGTRHRPRSGNKLTSNSGGGRERVVSEEELLRYLACACLLLSDVAVTLNDTECAWTKPMDMAGIQTKEDVATGSDEISGASARAHGFVVGTMSNGDKFHVRTQGTDTYKEGNIQASQGMWSFVGGYRETEAHQRQRHL